LFTVAKDELRNADNYTSGDVKVSLSLCSIEHHAMKYGTVERQLSTCLTGH